MRLTYIILAHHLPTQTIRLVRRLASPDSRFLIHWDRRSPDDDLRAILKEVKHECDVTPLPRHACYWGTFSIVAATLEGIDVACADPRGFERLILLSGQDYPIKSRSAIEAFFASHPHQSFIEHVAFPKPNWPGGGWSRVQMHWEVAPEGSKCGLQAKAIQPEMPEPLPMGLHPHGGTQFWVMTAEAAAYVQEVTHIHPEVSRFFEHAFAPDEIYMQTLLACSPFAETLHNGTLHFVKWSRPEKILTVGDLDELAASPHLFARKFDTRIDAKVLDFIDDRIL
jgi:core-2/I-Branching enzyme